MLLVNMGTEGWNCPSLFACALARRLQSSNNFVLQASTRCLRQVAGNTLPARIYLSSDNRGVLDSQLQETYGETLADLERAGQERRVARLVLRKWTMPPLVMKHLVRRVAARPNAPAPLRLERPDLPADTPLRRAVLNLGAQPGSASVLHETAEEYVALADEPVGVDLYRAATELAAIYRRPAGALYAELKRVYGPGALIPERHLPTLAEQIEARGLGYEIVEEEVEVALALVKPAGFKAETDAGGQIIYTTEITYQKGREGLLQQVGDWQGQNAGDFGFHYAPYNFDSHPEKDFFGRMLGQINLHPAEVEDIYFTGALTDPEKTDFYVEYLGADKKTHRYSPDFIIRRKDGRCYIVEVKMEKLRSDPVDGERGAKRIAVQGWVDLNPELLKYEMIFTPDETVNFHQLGPAIQFIHQPA